MQPTRAETGGRYSQAMTDLSRGARVRRSGRRPGWILLTALLVLAIGASSALVFTNQVELLKLAVILALWAAVVAAFVSVIYRRQSDVDQARARDLKLVYDLQLDREISARREYELTVESQLRRELASELRAQANDDVSELRAELAALRTNLEFLFDAELSERPALEGDRNAVRAYGEWDRDSARERVNRVTSVRGEDSDPRTDDSIIDVHEEPLAPAPPRQPPVETYHQAYAPAPPEAYLPRRQSRPAEEPERDRGPQRRASDHDAAAAAAEPAAPVPENPVPRPPASRGWTQPSGWQPVGPERVEPSSPRRSHRRSEPAPAGDQQIAAEPTPPKQQRIPWPPPTEPGRRDEPAADWRPVGSEGQWLPAGAPGSHWDASREETPAPAPLSRPDETPARIDPAPPRGSGASDAEPVRRGRHSSGSAEATTPADPEPPAGSEGGRRFRSRHAVDATDPGGPAPAMSPPPAPPPPAQATTPDRGPAMSPPPSASARHRSAESEMESEEPSSAGQSVAELLARLQSTPSGGGRRRRRED